MYKNGANIKAFTLAEVLITLAIIGVVSALVIPSVLKNYNDKKYNTARLKALKTFGEAGKMASINGEINGQENARAFVENVLSKYLKVVKICDNDKASECNFPSQVQPNDPSANKLASNNLKTWQNLNPATYGGILYPDIVANADMSVYIMAADGLSAKMFYNPKCANNMHFNIVSYPPCTGKVCTVHAVTPACLNFIYDMNGVKAPNHVGEDIGFVTTFWSGLNASASAPGIIPYNINTSLFDEGQKDIQQSMSSCNGISNKILYTLPSIDEISSIVLNTTLSSSKGCCHTLWSGSTDNGYFWAIASNGGERFYRTTKNPGQAKTWCVRR